MRLMDRYGVGTTVDGVTYELMESYRWGARVSRAEFIRQAVQVYIELIRDANKTTKLHKRSYIKHTN